MSKLLFICKRRSKYNHSYSDADYSEGGYSHGSDSYGLSNSSKFVAEALQLKGIECKVVSVTDNNDIDREVSEYNPTHVIIEALWVVPEKFDILIPLHPDVIWNIRIHSKAPFLAHEGMALDWVNRYEIIKEKYPHQLNLSCNDYSFTVDLNTSLHSNIEYLPNIYLTDNADNSKVVREKDNIINIGCFGAIRPLKNQLIQAMAAIAFADEIGKTLHFHMNSGRTEQSGDNVLKNIKALFEGTKHELVNHEWYTHEAFINVVKRMDIGMQVSFSESFNIVAADFVKHNIPVVVSHEIKWASCLFKASTTDTNNIVDALEFAYSFKCVNAHVLNKWGLNIYNKRAIREWLRFLNEPYTKVTNVD